MTGQSTSWLATWRLYLLCSLVFHLVWEILQLPLYTLWRAGTAGEIAFAVVHCTAGDLMIASLALLAALLLLGDPRWPSASFGLVAAAAILIGVAYTAYSEWVNTVVRKSWAYSELMPVLPFIGTGLSPLLQWVVVPGAALVLARRQLTHA